MKEFQPYVRHLRTLVEQAIAGNVTDEQIHASLNGEPSRELRRNVPIEQLRADGVFFTGERLAKFALSRLRSTVSSKSRILDPACGAGDLLLRCSQLLPNSGCLLDAQQLWNKCLIGCDITPEFVTACQHRLRLKLLSEFGNRSGAEAIGNLPFERITVGCGISSPERYKKVTHVVVNPPYCRLLAPTDCNWTSGSVNAAALFLERAVVSADAGTQIVAILPEVIRSGSRYAELRRIVELHTSDRRVRQFGRFSTAVNVDVMVFEGRVKYGSKSIGRPWNWGRPRETANSVKSLASVSVGPVVPHRHQELTDKKVPYVCVKTIDPWTTIRRARASRCFSGRLTKPPFVVVRRTSKTGAKYRAMASCVLDGPPVAVENHLLVIQPNDHSEETAIALMENFRNSKTNIWLDKRIGCRHLTVSSIADLPLWEINDAT